MDLNKRLAKLEKQKRGGLQATFRIIHFVKKDDLRERINAYSLQVDGPHVRQRSEESHQDFFERAKAELFGDSAKKPGVHVLFGWNETFEAD